MSLHTKSAQLLRSDDDGLRICVMRKPDLIVDWDIWMRTLSPSLELLQSYHANKIDWDTFSQKFHEEVILGKPMHLKALVDLSKQQKVTILCWEIDTERCHRRLLAEACKQIDASISVFIE